MSMSDGCCSDTQANTQSKTHKVKHTKQNTQSKTTTTTENRRTEERKKKKYKNVQSLSPF